MIWTGHVAARISRRLLNSREQKSSISRAHVENYCCLPRVDGRYLLRAGREQTGKSGAEFLDEDAIKADSSVLRRKVPLVTKGLKAAKTVGEGCVAGLEAAAYAKKFR